MARTAHIAGVLGLWASTATLARLPADIRAALERAALDAAAHQRAMGAARGHDRDRPRCGSTA